MALSAAEGLEMSQQCNVKQCRKMFRVKSPEAVYDPCGSHNLN
jgi:hypothetical protein